MESRHNQAPPPVQSYTRSPGTAEGTADAGDGGDVAWTNVNNIKVSDNSYATPQSLQLPAQQQTYRLKGSNFGFSADIPEGVIIDGIRVDIEKRNSILNGKLKDLHVHLIKAGVVQTGHDKANPNDYPQSDSVISYGGESDLWGESWSRDDIINSGFGVSLQTNNYEASATRCPYIDHVQITIYCHTVG